MSRKRYQSSKALSSSFFVDSGSCKFIGVDDMANDSVRLSQLIPPDTQAIIGVARSGMTPASIVASMLHLPLLSMRQTKHDIIEAGNGWRIGGDKHLCIDRNSKVVSVDDTCMTGKSIANTKLLLQKYYPNAKTACLYVNPLASHKPDIEVQKLEWPHLLEWNLWNSVLSPNCATDFDGVLCNDCAAWQDDDGDNYLSFIRNAIPKYVTRRCKIPLIVTARIERYRKPTVEWLTRHGIQCDNLIMHPANSLRERQADDISAWKASQFNQWAKYHRARPRPSLFIESDDRQASRIHQLTNRMVVCPSTKKVYCSAQSLLD